MKRHIIPGLIAATLLASTAIPAVAAISPDELKLDGHAPAFISENSVILDDFASSAELRSYFGASSSLVVRDGDEILEEEASVGGDTEITNGEKTLSVRVRGDVVRDGKINARDLIAMLKMLASGNSSDIADVDASGKLNVRDIIAVMRKIVGYDVYFGEDMVYDATGSDAIDLYFTSLMNRIGQHDTAIYGPATGLVRLAKNELEDIQMFIVSREQMNDVTLELGDMTNDAGDKLTVTVLEEYGWNQSIYREVLGHAMSYVHGEAANRNYDRFGEALPKLGTPFMLGENESKGFAIEVRTQSDSAAGYYSAPIVLRAADGTVIKESVLRVLVWDFELPDKPASDTALGFHFEDVIARITKNYTTMELLTKSREEVFNEYMQFFSDNRLSPYWLPYDVLDGRSDAIMSDPRITSFCVLGGLQQFGDPYNGATDEAQKAAIDAKVAATYRKLATNKDWSDKAYIYVLDEPYNEGIFNARLGYDFMNRVVPDADWHAVIAMAGNNIMTDEDGNLTDWFDYIARYTDILCPQSYAFTKYYTREERKKAKSLGIELHPPGSYIDAWTSAEVFELYNGRQFIDRIEQDYLPAGKKLWWYVCNSPMAPHPNTFSYYQGAIQRALYWQQYMYHVNGFLYWGTQENWNGMNLKRDKQPGDAQLMYWGELFGSSGPVPSIRLVYVREGLDDFQYMTELESFMTRDEIIKKYVNRVTTDVLRYSEDYHDIENTRTAIGFALESHAKGEN